MLLPICSIKQYNTMFKVKNNYQTNGLDFLQVGLMVSYLIGLTVLLHSQFNDTNNPQPHSDSDSDFNDNKSDKDK